ncbi:3'-5' exonuclease [Alkalihalobacterium chitinilyticum]|uniref:Exonuclease domain-containing protein n=1 Tax=Alkalihalobacterium chitinilyticum TaxID=2980103 RepID=A0ABT5VEH2_9BACI|nr:3'-5' exonuclease [Alkalihalobacterium chitinilyticum]MDE5413536.1 exonuclease domain-containing protein [Alkalihalobacterium chitinilyticum]
MADVQQYVFFDFEMLCSNRGMPFEDMEAIRLGAVKYDLASENIVYFDEYIRPQNFRPLSSFCKKLTGIYDQDLVDAKDFPTVFEEFLTWVGGIKRTRFFSWSPSDISRLKLDADRHDISSRTVKKIVQRYVDFQAIFTKRVTKENVSVERGLDFYGLTFSGQQHNPMHDAFNTLQIYLRFVNDPKASDLIMLKQFIFQEAEYLPRSRKKLNQEISKQLEKDVHSFLMELKEIYKMKDASKLTKRARRLSQKYENILINRSGLFEKDVMDNIRLLVDFHHELQLSFEEHMSHASRIMILPESIIQPMNELSLKRGC